MKEWRLFRYWRVGKLFLVHQFKLSRQAARNGGSFRQSTRVSPLDDEVFMQQVKKILAGEA